MENMTKLETKTSKIGGSLFLTVPNPLVKLYDIKEDEVYLVYKEKGKLIFEKKV